MRNLAFKLTLAFLLVGLTGSILVALIVQQRTRTAFNQFLIARDQQILIQNLFIYYQANGSWAGIERHIDTIAGGGTSSRRDHDNLILVGSDHTVVYSGSPEQIGKRAPESTLRKAVALELNGQTIGWLVQPSVSRSWIPDLPESSFLRNVNTAAFLSAVVAVFLAFILGSLLAFTMTRSLRELTEATVDLAHGKLGRTVKVRSQDELGQLADSFNQMSQDLARATQARRQMTADIAHDLRTPLSVISGYAEALSDGKLEGTPEIYSILYQETRHLSRLVEDLRVLSLADAGELPLALQEAAPAALLERLAARHTVAAGQQGLTLTVKTGDNLPAIYVDTKRLSQALDNLITNAFRYTPPGGEITLSAQTVGSQVQLQVADTGSGISPADLPHIFDRFYRGSKSRPQTGESGLGLTIAKSIVEAHYGTLTVQSQPGQGTVFTITLAPASRAV